MAVDRSKIAYFSDDPIDKIVLQGQISVSNAGSVSTNTGYDVNYPGMSGTSNSIANPYGRSAMVRYRWSVDGGATWSGQDSNMFYGYSVDGRVNGVHQEWAPTASLRGMVAVGTTSSNIVFRTLSNYHTTSGIYSNLVFSPSVQVQWGGWSAISQNFIIQYWVYERV